MKLHVNRPGKAPLPAFDLAGVPGFIGQEALNILPEFLAGQNYSKIGVLVDSHTRNDCLPLLKEVLEDFELFEIPAGESHKQFGTCEKVWDEFIATNMDRRSVLINLGGGVVGDLGGFAASAFKRGMDFIQVPTTLLAMVDASIGGKTGVDFRNFKNLLGFHKNPAAVFICPQFLQTLDERELRSGFAEVIKHCLIADLPTWEAIKSLKTLPESFDYLIEASVKVKSAIVARDPLERGDRKSLNFGHTVGHAVESHFLSEGRSLTHGEAVAIGMSCEAYLSFDHGLLTGEALNRINEFLLQIFGKFELPEAELDTISAYSLQDKKNEGGRILCTFLDGIGQFKVNQEISLNEVRASLHYYTTLTELSF